MTGEMYIAKQFCVLSVGVYFLVIGYEDQIKPTQGRFEKGYQQKGTHSIRFCGSHLVVCIPYLSKYKLTFYSLKISPKNHPRLKHGSKTEIKKSSGQIFHVTIAYLKENS